MRSNCQPWESYHEERFRLRKRLSDRIRGNMASLINEPAASSSADVRLVAADGRKMAAHICILRQRAPVFFQRYVEPTLDATPRSRRAATGSTSSSKSVIEVAVGDVDSVGLSFFIHSIYTDEEVRQLLPELVEAEGSAEGGGRGHERDGEGGGFMQSIQNDGNGCRNGSTQSSSLAGMSKARSNSNESDLVGGVAPLNSERHCSSSDSLNNDTNQGPTSSNAGTLHVNTACDVVPSLPDNSGPLTSSFPSPTFHQHYYPHNTHADRQLPFNFAGNNTMPRRSNNNIMSNSFPSPNEPRQLLASTFADQTSSTQRRTTTGHEAPMMTSFRELASVSSLYCPSCGGTGANDSGHGSGVTMTTSGVGCAVCNNRQPPPRTTVSVENNLQRLALSRRPSAPALPDNNQQPLQTYDYHHQVFTNVPPLPPSAHTHPQQQQPHRSIFPMFINLVGEPCAYAIGEDGGPIMSQSFPMNTSNDSGISSAMSTSASGSGGSASLRCRALNARRLSMTSLASLTSIDLASTGFEGNQPQPDKSPASQLAADLLQMYLKSADTDVTVVTADGELSAHRCILSTNCSFFRQQLAANDANRVELEGFSKSAVDFLLSFLYGGVTTIPSTVDAWEVIGLAAHLNLDELTEVAVLHFRAFTCHWFHKPCASCVSAIFDALPKFRAINCLNALYKEALEWQASHFSRVWKGRVFSHLSEAWQRECFSALLDHINEENVVEVLLGCEKLQMCLPRLKAHHAAQQVLSLVTATVEYCTEFLVSSFHLLISSKSYRNHGMGLALDLSLLEDVLPSLVHSLSADVAIHAFINVRNLIVDIQSSMAAAAASQQPPPQLRRISSSQQNLNGSTTSLSSLASSVPDNWNPRFLALQRRIYELIDLHLLHYAASVVKSDAWELLNMQEKNRINEAGIFVELKMPKAPPPRFSSFNRTYKRSSSAAGQMLLGGGGGGGPAERTRSLERSTRPPPPTSNLSMLGEPSTSMYYHNQQPRVLEQILERRRSVTQMSEKSDSGGGNGGGNGESRIPTRSSSVRSDASATAAQPTASKKSGDSSQIQSSLSTAVSNTPSKIPTTAPPVVTDALKMTTEAAPVIINNPAVMRNDNRKSVGRVVAPPPKTQPRDRKSAASFISTTALDNGSANADAPHRRGRSLSKRPVIARLPGGVSSLRGKAATVKTSPSTTTVTRKDEAEGDAATATMTGKEEEEAGLQRQNTHTVMTLQQNRDAGFDPVKMGVPQAPPATATVDQPTNVVATVFSTVSKDNKPQSVVRPMPKASISLAASAAIPLLVPQTTAPISPIKKVLATSRPLAETRSTLSDSASQKSVSRSSALPRLAKTTTITAAAVLQKRSYQRPTISSVQSKSLIKTVGSSTGVSIGKMPNRGAISNSIKRKS